MELKKGQKINFDTRKYFSFIENLGEGGTGETYLFEDETTNMLFAFKKFSPYNEDDREELYIRFVDEIKILFCITHPNIVRIFNYYLYPTFSIGYLQMEYIKGQPINEYYPTIQEKGWNEIFLETLRAFEYLENNNILHRDIRPANILIDQNENVKIIDFGFGKVLSNEEQIQNSVMLNWPATIHPKEIMEERNYTQQSEIYYLGYMFSKLIDDITVKFKYNHIIEKMTQIDPKERYNSFSEAIADSSTGILATIDFNDKEKEVYLDFVNPLISKIKCFKDSHNFVINYDEVINKLEGVLYSFALEKYLQDNTALIECFVVGNYSYYTKTNIQMSSINAFYDFIKSVSLEKRNLIFDNIFIKLRLIRIEESTSDISSYDLPF